MTLDAQYEALRLGASLYMPATRPDLSTIANGRRFGMLRSVIFCTEDAVTEGELSRALTNLEFELSQIQENSTRCFVRVRNPQVLTQVLMMNSIDRVDGFVIPKSTTHRLFEFLERIFEWQGHENSSRSPWIMPTLETEEVFEQEKMRTLRRKLESHACFAQLLAMRIGGNDLLNVLGLKRRPGRTIYDSPLRNVLADLAKIFLPAGIELTAPVFDRLDDDESLKTEIEQDLDHGFLCKPAIHPSQVSIIESKYSITFEESEIARSVLENNVPAVYRLHNQMCEPATHANWARKTLNRGDVFGVGECESERQRANVLHAPIVNQEAGISNV